jgi:hypothetical protein
VTHETWHIHVPTSTAPIQEAMHGSWVMCFSMGHAYIQKGLLFQMLIMNAVVMRE